MQCLNKLYKIICCINDAKYPNPYHFDFGSEEERNQNAEVFESNFIKTSKYTWYDFLPKSLISQFYRLANCFFLLIAILQTIPAISPLGSATAWVPLIFVLAISMIREGYEDYQRYLSDKQLNHQETAQIFKNGKFVQVQWSQVVIGDICRVKQNDLFPVDLILLTSSTQDGTVFIQTASLDGQKNLKPRNAFPQTQQLVEQSLNGLSGTWEGIIPDKHTQNFSSTLIMQGQKTFFKRQKQLLWRGTRLMNTKWIYGLCIYTGRNTKIMLNSSEGANKMSQIEVKVNYILGFILIVQVILSFIVGILAGIFNRDNNATHTYIIWSNTPAVDGVLLFFSYFVLVNTMIPISLIVSIEIVKVTQSYFINKDRFMFSNFRQKGTQVKSASLNQQLGQIEHIFSDKTGTLTTNLMEFKIACVGTQMYGDLGLISHDKDRPTQNSKGFHDDDFKKLIRAPDSRHNAIKQIYVKDREKKKVLKFDSKKTLGYQYLTALSVAHEVVVQEDEKGNKKYQGPSPDEITLVEAAKDMGFEFIKSTQTTTNIEIHGDPKQFQLLQIFAFNSDRKRMSVVVRDGDTIKMYTKGADSIIKKRLADDQTFNLDSELNRFSVIGLRTLLIAMRIISQKEYNQFKQKSESLPADRKQQAMDELINDLETDLYLIGATAVLDRLQDEVPETIRDLIRANIKVWMLTGDKLETAENIAKSCNLIQEGFEVLTVKFSERTDNGVRNSLIQLRKKSEHCFKDHKKMTVLVQGTDLAEITKQDELQDHFIAIAEKCESVVCCRLLPLQKAEVVRMVRAKLNKITLAIGDGANDVPMIKAAHIGIGLFGEEGMSAVQACDYALPEFRMLWRLLLVHGRWNYIRIAEMILYFFYKNMLFTVPQFLFSFYCGYSGQTVFEDWYVSFYNLFFTSLPLIVRAVFEQDIYYLTKADEKTVQKLEQHNGSGTVNRIQQSRLHTPYSNIIPKGYIVNKYIYRLFPKIYYIGQQNCIFNYRNFFLWVIEGALQACLIFFSAIYIFDLSMNSSGYNSDLWIVSLVIYTTVIMIVSFKLATHTKFMSPLLLFSLGILAIGIYIAYMWISNVFPSSVINGTIPMFYESASTYFVVIFGVCLILFIDGFIISIDYDNSGAIGKLRDIVHEQKEYRQSQFEKQSLTISIGTNVNRQAR